MKYYHLHINQSIYCGCYEDIYMEAENENEVNTFAKNNAYDILCEYLCEDRDYDEPWSQTIYWDIEEITKEEYEENK